MSEMNIVVDFDRHNEAVEALRALLWELPAEFSDCPPDPAAHHRDSFLVIKESNVRTVHKALWELQKYFGLQEN